MTCMDDDRRQSQRISQLYFNIQKSNRGVRGVYAHKKAFQKTRARKIMQEGRNYAKYTCSTKRNLGNVSGDVTVPSTTAHSL